MSKGKAKSHPNKCSYCQKLSHMKYCCYKKLAKKQSKDHVNLVAASTSDLERGHIPNTSTMTHALTTKIRGLCLPPKVDKGDDPYVF